MRLLHVDAYIAASKAGIDVIAEAQKSARAAEQAASEAERWGRLAVRATDARSAALFASIATSAALRCGMHAGEAHDLAPGSAADNEAGAVVSSAELHARAARGAADALAARVACTCPARSDLHMPNLHAPDCAAKVPT